MVVDSWFKYGSVDHVESRGVKILVDCQITSFELTKNICYIRIKTVNDVVQLFSYYSSHTVCIPLVEIFHFAEILSGFFPYFQSRLEFFN